MPERWPQFLPWRYYVWIFTEQLVHFHKKDPMKNLVTWISLNVHVDFTQTQTNVRTQWNTVHEAFHRICHCGNERKILSHFKRDLHAANLLPALEQGCGKQTPSGSILFCRMNLVCVLNIKM